MLRLSPGRDRNGCHSQDGESSPSIHIAEERNSMSARMNTKCVAVLGVFCPVLMTGLGTADANEITAIRLCTE